MKLESKLNKEVLAAYKELILHDIEEKGSKTLCRARGHIVTDDE